ncbi:MAG: TonB-dependent receptor [Rudaea sp.]|uniref:TonB-dependent receptor n=1 Tax=unclassified Rudaea TaxID=2627037 RepID=UPI0010F4B32E|nr:MULTISPECIES: TonB-dependent receptor [unclassified Rudaea]MBN8884645.1 TonB-dependent receptor [Rudaea sp.]
MKRTNTTHANAPCPKTIRLALTVAILAALTPMIALAADAAPAPSPDPQAAAAAAPAAAPKNAAQAAKTETQTLEGMVVTGSASNNGVKKIDASYIITAVNAEQIKQANPKSTADLLKVSPGLWPESTGGQTGANIEIAGFPGGGDAPYFTTMMMGSPLYGAPTLSFFETTSAFRLDDTIERAEIVQGGPTVVLGPGQIGATANFILKQGTSEPSGSIGITYGDEGLWRLDGFYGFKIADGWYGSIGGFWRTSDGVRSPGFKADQGGQLTATLTHDLDNGSFTLYARRIDDKNQFITPIPLHQNSPGNFSAYPGFDPLTSTYYSKAMQNVTLQGAYGPVNADLGNGRGAKMNFFGGNFDYEIAGWSISDKFLYNEGDMNTNALFSGNNTKPLSYYLYGCNIPNGVFCGPGGKPLDSDNLNLAAGTPYSAVYTTGGNVPLTQSVVHQGWWYIQKHLKNLVNDLRVSREIFEGNTLTVGLYLAHYTDDDKWSLGNQMLMSNTPNAKPIVLSYQQNGHTYYVSNNQGFSDFNGNYNIAEKGSANNKALYISDSWRVDRWLFDAGIRVENQQAHLLVCNQSKSDLDGNPYTLYDNLVPSCNGTFTRTDYDKTHPAFSVGANYEIADNMSAYARATKGPHFGDFDNTLRGNATGNTPPVQKLQSFEIGYKFQNEWIFADISAYHRQFSGLTYQPTTQSGVPTGPTSVYGSDSKGVNVTGYVSPFENFRVDFTGNYQDGKYSHYNACQTYTDVNTGEQLCAVINGVQLQRQPKVRFFLTPNYRIPFEWGSLMAFVTYTHVGDHTQDLSGLQQLGSYNTWDFGVVANVGKNWEFRMQGTNLTNELGLTESNSRFFGNTAGVDGTILARPLEGREINVQAKYKF